MRALPIILILSLMPIVSAPGVEDTPYLLDWMEMELTVSGSSRVVTASSGNPAEWQLEAVLRAEDDLMSHFIESMAALRIDGLRSAADVLTSDRERNGDLYAYYGEITGKNVRYGGETVRVTKSFPFFGHDGLLPILVSAGTDYGHFPEYEGYVFSEDFTGLVVDARQQGKVPAALPRLYDEEHRLVYSAELMDDEFYRRWGSVLYVRDPSRAQAADRVGVKPLRIVAAPDDKLMETDIALYDEDARRLLQYAGSRRSLLQGRVVIIID